MNRAKYLIKNLGILTICNLTSKILIFLLIPLYTAVLSPEELGIYDLLISTVQLLFPLLTLNIVTAVMRFVFDEDASTDDIAYIGIKYVVVSGLVVFFTALIAGKVSALAEIHGYIWYFFFYYITFGIDQYLIQLAKGMEKVFDMGIAGVISVVTLVVSNVYFLLVAKWGLTGFFLSIILGQVFSTIFLSVRLKIWKLLWKGSDNDSLERRMLIYSIPLIATEIGWWVNQTSDRYIVSAICGIASTGVLSVSYKIPHIINSIYAIFVQAWNISAIKEHGNDDSEIFYGRMFQITNYLLCVVCSLLILLSKLLAHLLFSNDFYVSWQYVPFLLISSVINGAAGMCGSILAAEKKSAAMGISTVYGAVLNLFMNILLVKSIGLQGATIATAISSFVILFYRKHEIGSGIKNDNYPIMILGWILLCVQAVIEIYSSLWFFELVILALMIIMNLGSLKIVLSYSMSMFRTQK